MHPPAFVSRALSFGLVLGALLAPGAGYGQESLQSQPAASVVPKSQAQITLSFAPVVKAVAPAVVNIYAERVVRQMASPFLNDPLFAMMFGQDPGFSIPRERLESALGSGVVVRADGLIVTNSHVIREARNIRIVLNDRREFPARVVTVDDKTDLALLRAEVGGAKLPVLSLGDSDNLEVGDLVLAVGNPFGVGQTVTSGIVWATARTAEGLNTYGYYIQTDAAINPGNSGGALVDMSGRLVGINTAIYSRTGGSLGIGFAVPSNMVRVVVAAGEGGHKLVRPWLGVGVQDVTSDLASSLGLERPQGVLVKTLHPASPLKQAGLKAGDVILTLNDQPVDSPESMEFRIGTLNVGGQVQVRYWRQGEAQTASFALIAPPEVPARATTALTRGSSLAGASIANLSPAVREEIGYDGPVQDGVIVVDVAEGSPAGFAGLEKGDILSGVNRQPTPSVDTFIRAFESRQERWILKVQRGDRVINALMRR